MSAGKRLSTSEPLTEHDVAERLDRAAIRTVRILMAARQAGMAEQVRHSRYLTNSLAILAAELRAWGVEPEQGHRPLSRKAATGPHAGASAVVRP